MNKTTVLPYRFKRTTSPKAAQFYNPAILVKVKIHQELPSVTIIQYQSRTESTTPVWSEYTNPCIDKKPPIPIRIRKDQSSYGLRTHQSLSTNPNDGQNRQNLPIPIWGRIYQSQYRSESTNPNLGQNLPVTIWGRIYQSQSGAESTNPNLGQNPLIPIWGRICQTQSGAEFVNPNLG